MPISLPQVVPNGWRSKRADLRWLVPDGGRCAAHQMLAYCNFGARPPAPLGMRMELAQEEGGFRIALIARHAGIVRHARRPHGGWYEQLEFFDYHPGAIVGTLMPFVPADDDDARGACLTQIVAGRKATPLAVDQTSLHAGWHDRRRSWLIDHGPPEMTVLGLGICELTGIMLGGENSFTELLTMLQRPVHLVNVPDVPLVPTARIVAQQLERSDADRSAIWSDFCEGMAQVTPSASPDDWIFGGSLIKGICAAPAAEEYGIFSPEGIGRLHAADVVILSLSGESPVRIRHCRLGYDIRFHPFRFQQMSPSLRSWVKDNFEQVPQTMCDIRADHIALLQLLNRGPRRRQLMLLNALTARTGEDIQSYAGQGDLDRLASVWAKQLSAMADELAHDHAIAVIDADAIAAELGSGYSAPDGVHHSGEMQQALRGEIVRCLDRCVPA